jgi:hypothetical protein
MAGLTNDFHVTPSIKGASLMSTTEAKPDIKSDVLAEAQRIVTGARRAAYGKPEDNFRRICDLWNAHRANTGRPPDMTPADVAMFMIQMKVARLAETPDHRDSIVDVIGYAACYAEMVLSEPTKPK